MAEIEKIPEPFSVMDVEPCGNFPFFQNCIERGQDIRWNGQHGKQCFLIFDRASREKWPTMVAVTLASCCNHKVFGRRVNHLMIAMSRRGR